MKHKIIYAIPFRMMDGDPQFLVMKRVESSFVPPDFWQMVSGTIEEGEWSPETALREVTEETGLSPERMYLVDYVHQFWLAHWDEIILTPVFACQVGEGEIVLSEEHSRYLWLSYDEALKRLPRKSQKRSLTVFYEDIFEQGRAEEFLIWEKDKGWQRFAPPATNKE